MTLIPKYHKIVRMKHVINLLKIMMNTIYISELAYAIMYEQYFFDLFIKILNINPLFKPLKKY